MNLNVKPPKEERSSKKYIKSEIHLLHQTGILWPSSVVGDFFFFVQKKTTLKSSNITFLALLFIFYTCLTLMSDISVLTLYYFDYSA